ncbi:unnamed protein product [Linum trigynum]|uniref:Uncharacterized protein n=1 Tax=Linum trigynum TaxID=586398 RepID=A0AAV2FT70_9ROSI
MHSQLEEDLVKQPTPLYIPGEFGEAECVPVQLVTEDHKSSKLLFLVFSIIDCNELVEIQGLFKLEPAVEDAIELIN